MCVWVCICVCVRVCGGVVSTRELEAVTILWPLCACHVSVLAGSVTLIHMNSKASGFIKGKDKICLEFRGFTGASLPSDNSAWVTAATTA